MEFAFIESSDVKAWTVRKFKWYLILHCVFLNVSLVVISYCFTSAVTFNCIRQLLVQIHWTFMFKQQFIGFINAVWSYAVRKLVHEDSDISDMSLKCLTLIIQLYGPEASGVLTVAHLVRLQLFSSRHQFPNLLIYAKPWILLFFIIIIYYAIRQPRHTTYYTLRQNTDDKKTIS